MKLSITGSDSNRVLPTTFGSEHSCLRTRFFNYRQHLNIKCTSAGRRSWTQSQHGYN